MKKIIKDDGFEGSKAKSIINADLENIRNGNFDSVLSNEKLDTDEVYEILIEMAIDSKDALLLSALNSIKNKKPTKRARCCEYCGSTTIDFDMCNNCKELLA